MVSWLVNSQEQVDNQLSLRIQEVVRKVTLDRGQQFRDGTLEYIFLFVQVRMMCFRTTIL